MTPRRYRLYLPDHFLQKDVNEAAVGTILSRALGVRTVRRGDPRLREPDLLLDGTGEEVTFAAESNRLPMHPLNAAVPFPGEENGGPQAADSRFIGNYCDGVYSPEEAQNAMTVPILAALERKAKKRYVNAPVNVAVLCMLELFDWTADIYGDTFYGLPHRERDAFFAIVRALYIESGLFSNVHLLVPTLARSWAVFDVANGARYLVAVAPEDDLPYFLEQPQ